MTVAGRVVGADGKPVPGAALALIARPRRQYRSGAEAEDRVRWLGGGKTDGSGDFTFPAVRTSSARFWEVYLVAGAPGHGIDWRRLGPDVERPEATLALPPEQVLRGRLVDLQGEPAAGVRVSVSWVGGEVNGEWDGVSLAEVPQAAGLWPAPVKTDDKGRFTVHGCNRDRGFSLAVADDRFAGQSFEITAPGKPRKEKVVHGLDAGGYLHTHRQGPDDKGQPEEPTFTLSPAQVLEGRVVCGDTGKPLASASVSGTRTDAGGRFRVPVTFAARQGVTLEVVPPEGAPYLTVFHRVEWPQGATRREVEVRLPPGVLVRGKVTEADGRTPVAGACVEYWPREGNPAVPREAITGWERRELTAADGTFRVAVAPGEMHLLVQGPTPDYVHEEIGHEVVRRGLPGGSRLYPDGIVKLTVRAGEAVPEVAVRLRRGVTVRGRLMGPDAKPVEQAVVLNRLHVYIDLGWHFATEARGGVFEVHGLAPEQTVPVLFLDPQKRSGAVVPISGKQAGQEVLVKLAPCGRASARYLDAKGKPLSGFSPSPEVVLTPAGGGLEADRGDLVNLDRHNYWTGRVRTDAAGRVTFPALVPGASYRISRFTRDRWKVLKEFKVESAQTIDLGDVVIDKGDGTDS
jgi:protocatechuate 3,4-dioxygenase beta subunit